MTPRDKEISTEVLAHISALAYQRGSTESSERFSLGMRARYNQARRCSGYGRRHDRVCIKRQMMILDARKRLARQNKETYERLAQKRISRLLKEKQEQMEKDGYELYQIEIALDDIRKNDIRDKKVAGYIEAAKMYEEELINIDKEKQIHEFYIEHAHNGESR